MTKNNPLLLLILSTALCCSSCIEYSFYHSPIQGNTAAYHAMPLASDSIKSATYVNGGLSIGSMNDGARDGVYSLQAGIHRGHVLDNFRLNYGASIALGSYHVSPYYDYYNYNGNSPINIDAASRFFGAYGAYGGISAAVPMGGRGEWRYIGVDGNLFNEFGQYATFRKNLPDSEATEIDKRKYLGSVGINTELIFKYRSGNKFGIKIGVGSYLRTLHYYDPYPGNYYHPYDNLIYFSNTYHFTFKKNTAYFQLNAATHAVHFQMGYNYRL